MLRQHQEDYLERLGAYEAELRAEFEREKAQRRAEFEAEARRQAEFEAQKAARLLAKEPATRPAGF